MVKIIATAPFFTKHYLKYTKIYQKISILNYKF